MLELIEKFITPDTIAAAAVIVVVLLMLRFLRGERESRDKTMTSRDTMFIQALKERDDTYLDANRERDATFNATIRELTAEARSRAAECHDVHRQAIVALDRNTRALERSEQQLASQALNKDD